MELDYDTLIIMLQKSNISEVVAHGKDAVPALIKALGDPECTVKEKAIWALENIGDASAVPALIIALGDADLNVRAMAAWALVKIGKPAVPALIRVLGDADSDVRWRAAVTLGEIKDASAVPALIRVLEDADSDVKWGAAGALGQIKDASAVPALIKVLVGYANPNVRSRVAKALENIGDASAVPALIIALLDENGMVRNKAAKALSEIGKRIVTLLIDAFRENKQERISEYILLLGKIDSKMAISEVIASLLDVVENRYRDNVGVRWNAIEALNAIRKNRPKDDADVRQNSIDSLIETLGNNSWNARLPATIVLQKMGKDAVPHLIKALWEVNRHTRYYAILILENINDERGLKFAKLIGNKDVNYALELGLDETKRTLIEFVRTIEKNRDLAKTNRVRRELAEFYNKVAAFIAKKGKGISVDDGELLRKTVKPPEGYRTYRTIGRIKTRI